MECKNEHFRRILLFYFHKGKNAAQAAKKLHDVYGEKALKDKQCRNWFDKFRSRDFSIKIHSSLSLVMKNGLFTITWFENNHGPSVMNHHKQHQKLNCNKERLCCLFGGIGKMWYF